MNILKIKWGFDMTQNKKAVKKRAKEIEEEYLDRTVKHIYIQKDEDNSLIEVKYRSGRVVRERS